GATYPSGSGYRHFTHVTGIDIRSHQHTGLVVGHGLEDNHRGQDPDRIVNERLAPRERAELQGRGPDLLQSLVNVIERLAVEHREVEPRAVEVVEIFDIGVATDEAADASRLVVALEEPFPIEAVADGLLE